MIDEKKLIAYLEKERDYWHHSTAPYSLEVMCMYSDTIDFVNEQPKVGEWIPCSERLPEDDIDVLATVDGGRYIAVYIFHIKDGEWIDFDGFVVDAAKVTAWQPLPEPWEGEDK